MKTIMPPLERPDPVPALIAAEQRDVVPAYFRPHWSDPKSLWKRIASVMNPGSIAIMNPGNGPSTAVEPEYNKVIGLCHAYRRQLKVVGYVTTDRGQVPLTKVMEDIDNYRLWYPRLDGIFLDEMNNNAQEDLQDRSLNEDNQDVRSYYEAIRDKVRERRNQTIVGNPGDVSEAQGDWAFDVVDILVANEDDATGYLTWQQPQWVYPGTNRADAYRVAHLVHGVRASASPAAPSQEKDVLAASRVRHAGYVYVTDEVATPGDPLWNRLPASWANRMALPLPPVVT